MIADAQHSNTGAIHEPNSLNGWHMLYICATHAVPTVSTCDKHAVALSAIDHEFGMDDNGDNTMGRQSHSAPYRLHPMVTLSKAHPSRSFHHVLHPTGKLKITETD